MQETANQYIKRILSYNEKGDPVKSLERNAQRLDRIMRKAKRSNFRKSRGKGTWTFAHILSHLAEGELVSAYRMRAIVNANGCDIQAYDQNQWVQNAAYLRKNPKSAYELFRTVRNSNFAFLKSLSKKQWNYYGMHSERGKETIQRLASMMAGHDVNHLSQLEEIA